MSFLFGAGMGLLLGGPLGAVVGGAIQHFVTAERRDEIMPGSYSPNPEAVFVTNLAAIATKICMADGHISREERMVIHNFFSKNLNFHGEELKFIDGLIEETKTLNPDLRSVCYSFKEMAGYEQRLFLLDLSYQIALADQKITKEEQTELDHVAEYLGISNQEAERIHKKHTGASKNDPYGVLGLPCHASIDEVRAAYKQLATQYHPDKVSHLGPELIDFAEKKFTEINNAYNSIKKENSHA